MTYLPSAVSDFFLTRVVPTAWRMIPSSGKKTSMFLDPVDVITGLAITSLYTKNGEHGIKLSILENRVRRDHNRGYLQSVKRAYDGTHHEQLSDLTAPIFYALKWFRPHENPRFAIVFRLAMEGIAALMETYKTEENKFTVEYLHTAHFKLLDDGLNGKPINCKELRIPNWEKKPLAQRCLQLWQKDSFERLQQICILFQTALHPGSLTLIENFPIKPLVEIIKQRVDEVVIDLLRYKQTLVSFDEEDEFITDLDTAMAARGLPEATSPAGASLVESGAGSSLAGPSATVSASASSAPTSRRGSADSFVSLDSAALPLPPPTASASASPSLMQRRSSTDSFVPLPPPALPLSHPAESASSEPMLRGESAESGTQQDPSMPLVAPSTTSAAEGTHIEIGRLEEELEAEGAMNHSHEDDTGMVNASVHPKAEQPLASPPARAEEVGRAAPKEDAGGAYGQRTHSEGGASVAPTDKTKRRKGK